MKKVLLISASVLALSAGAAFAQTTTSDLYQNGSSNGATINQANGGSGSVYSYVHQGDAAYGNSAYNSSATVTQIGNNGGATNSWVVQNDSNQGAIVTQTNSVGGTQNSGITQSGNGNNANVTQLTANSSDNQYSSVTQGGQYGTVTLQQYGPHDNSQVSQTGYGSNPSWSGNSTAYQYVAGGVSIYQTGSSTNTSYATQNSDYSGIAVTQQGNSGGQNWSNVTQGAAGNYNNTASVSQWADATGFNSSTIGQSGNWNIAGVVQSAGNGITNTSTINQNGNGNSAAVYQH